MWRHARGAEPTVNHELGRRDDFAWSDARKSTALRHVPAIAHPSHGHLPMARAISASASTEGAGASTTQDFNGDIALIACSPRPGTRP